MAKKEKIDDPFRSRDFQFTLSEAFLEVSCK